MDLQWVASTTLRGAAQRGAPAFFASAIDIDYVSWDIIVENFQYCKNRFLRGTVQSEEVSTEPLKSICTGIKQELTNVFPIGKKDLTSHIYCSFVSNAESYGWHHDKADVLIIGVKGTTVYEIMDPHSDKLTYEVKRGDVLFIPKGVEHNAIIIGPRAIISLGIEKGIYDV